MRNTNVALLLVAGVLAAGLPARAEDTGASEAVSSARDTLARWVETQQVISREGERWLTAREMLEQRISLLESEIATLTEKIDEAEAGLGEVDSRRRDLLAERAALQQASSGLTEGVAGLESRTRALVERLPDPIHERVRPLAARLPADPASTRLTVSERFQNVIGVLNEINKFNGEVAVVSELRALPDGATAEVQALYVGLGQAWYVTPDGRAAGVGRPGPDGWEWTPADELAPDVARAIAIIRNEAVPAYVPLPVEIR